MLLTAPLVTFRQRTLSADPATFTTGWEDVLIPYGLARAGAAFGDTALVDWAHRWFEIHHTAGYVEDAQGPYVATRGGHRGFVIGDYCGNWGGPLVFAALQRARPDERLRIATGTICDGLLRQAPRMADGAFAHGGWDFARQTLWVDTLFYSSAVLAEAYGVTGQIRYAEEALKQAMLHVKWLRDPATGGFFHDINPATGTRSHALWARGNGWALLALADTLRLCPPSLPGWNELLATYRSLVTCLLRLQHSSGLWRIVPENAEAHLESSGSAMILAGLALGLTAGWLDPCVRSPILKGFTELLTWIDEHGALQGAQRPAGCGGWESHKLSAMGECVYATGLFWRLLGELKTAGLLPADVFALK